MTAQTRLTHIAAPDGVGPGTAYTHVVIGSGRLVAVSGQVAMNENGEVVGRGDSRTSGAAWPRPAQRSVMSSG
jgi:enamine deaminase RidA (YjgF/YER057c/UK114 family)